MSIYDDKNAFTVRLDPGMMRMSMQLWREATDMKIPIHDSLKLHFIANRRAMLNNHARTAKAWGTMLESMRAPGLDQAHLDKLKAQVDEFREWAEAGLAELDQVRDQEALQDAMQDGLAELAKDPAGRALLQRALDEGWLKPPPGGYPKGKR
ncbi:hypothetical protein FHW83_005915 [Duganella sp. SG902]|uniref:hypothetical protein n=1 Tax=Duganella sp. SG902 TaxID=2587016 RepID=UPI00159E74F8|nr:hypothetical protein [Duganella sp. SG902]NVM80070.1 hypothetical protein [Duganella sp. SG902]